MAENEPHCQRDPFTGARPLPFQARLAATLPNAQGSGADSAAAYRAVRQDHWWPGVYAAGAHHTPRLSVRSRDHAVAVGRRQHEPGNGYWTIVECGGLSRK